MSTSFTVDLTTNTFNFGSIAKGQITNLKGDIRLNSGLGTMPYSGIIQADFVGEIKNGMVIPDVVPHRAGPQKNGFGITVIGCGGTGGYLIRDLTRFIYSLREKGDKRNFNIRFVDPDIVEQKNVLRQNFTGKDVGQHKAVVQAKRYASAFGLEIEAIPEKMDSRLLNEILSSDFSDGRCPIVIGCVDNNAARREIAVKMEHDIFYWVDSGNESKSGQVVLGYGRRQNSYGRMTFNKNTNYMIPHVGILYPEILDPKQDDTKNKEISCAERAIVDVQNIFVNTLAAGHVLTFVRQIISDEPITVNSIEFNIKGLTTVTHLTQNYLENKWTRK